MRKNIATVAVAGAGLLFAGSANALNYSYVQAGVAFYPSFESETFIGAEVQGMFAITEDIFILGGGVYLTDNVDLTALHIGGAYRFEIQPGTDVYGGLTIEYQDIDAGAFGSFDDTSIGIRGGVRHRLNDDLELAGQLRLVTGDLDYFGIRAGAVYSMSESLSLIGDVDLYDGEFGIIAGARFNF